MKTNWFGCFPIEQIRLIYKRSFKKINPVNNSATENNLSDEKDTYEISYNKKENEKCKEEI